METQNTPLKKAFWILGGLMFVVGLPAWYHRMVGGLAVTNLGNVVVWGLWIAAYLFFIGSSAGAFLVSSLIYVFDMKRFEPIGRVALFTAFVTLLMALLLVVVDLGHIDRAWHVLVYANFTSPLAWMIYLYSFYMVVLALEMWFLMRSDFVRCGREGGRGAGLYRLLALGSRDDSEERRRRDRRIVRVLAIIGIPTAIMFHGGAGALLGIVASRPHWHSGLFPILFLLSALVSGGALLTVVAAIFQDGVRRHRQIVLDLGKLVVALLALDVLFQISEYLIAFRGGIPGHIEGLKLVLTGPFKEVFWIAQLLLGTLIPLLLLLLPTRKNPWVVVLACAFIVVGIFGLRLNIVIPGLAVEEIHGLTAAVSTPRITATYFPSAIEWLLTIGVSGLGMLLFGLGEKLLPKLRTEEH
jgi:molybdopterin-containing oxidoreductase family membrane subunit